jgi:calcium/calmodulin-dependent protein kinase I
MKKVRAGKFSFDDKCWNSISDNAKDFVRRLLTYEQDKRPSAEQAL